MALAARPIKCFTGHGSPVSGVTQAGDYYQRDREESFNGDTGTISTAKNYLDVSPVCLTSSYSLYLDMPLMGNNKSFNCHQR